MENRSYKSIAVCIFALLLGLGGYAQDGKSGTAKDKELNEKQVKELRDKQRELRDKQQELNKELREVNEKLSEQVRTSVRSTLRLDSGLFNKLQGAGTFAWPHDSLLQFNNARIFKLDSSVALALKNSKLATIDLRNNLNVLGNLKLSENMNLFNDKTVGGLVRGFSYDPNYKAVEKTKTISRSYPVDAKDRLSVNNQYGTVTINTWNKNEIKVDVEVKAYEGSDDRAQDLLDGVRIEDSKQNNLVSFKTVISTGKNAGWFFQGRNGAEQRRGVVVNYTVYMPAKSSLDVTNKLGSINLPDLDGVVNVNLKNGTLKALKLSNAGNRIVVNEGNADIGQFGLGNINVSYGNLKINVAEQLTARVTAGTTRIGTLYGGNLDINMGALRLDELASNLKNVNITADKSSVALGIDPSANFDFDVTLNLAGFKYNAAKVNLTQNDAIDRTKGYSQTQNYKGQYGKGSDSKVTIKSSYGSVQFL